MRRVGFDFEIRSARGQGQIPGAIDSAGATDDDRRRAEVADLIGIESKVAGQVQCDVPSAAGVGQRVRRRCRETHPGGDILELCPSGERVRTRAE